MANQSRSLTQIDIETGLRQLGLAAGNVAEVHSSLSSFGRVDGGADTVVDALMSVVGLEGAIVMPAQPLTRPLPLTEEDRRRGIIAKVHRLPEDDLFTPTGMGAIADAFRRRPGVAVGSGPFRVCAWGRDSAEFVRQGFAHLLAVDGLSLLLGVDIHRCSSMHQAERKAGLPPEVEACYCASTAILRDYPAEDWYVQCGDTPEDGWGKIQDEAHRLGMVRRGWIGRADCRLFRAAQVVGLYEAALRSDPFKLFGIENV